MARCCGNLGCRRAKPIRLLQGGLTGQWSIVTDYTTTAPGLIRANVKHDLDPGDAELLANMEAAATWAMENGYPEAARERDGYVEGDPNCGNCHGLSHTTIPPCSGCGGTCGEIPTTVEFPWSGDVLVVGADELARGDVAFLTYRRPPTPSERAENDRLRMNHDDVLVSSWFEVDGTKHSSDATVTFFGWPEWWGEEDRRGATRVAEYPRDAPVVKRWPWGAS